MWFKKNLDIIIVILSIAFIVILFLPHNHNYIKEYTSKIDYLEKKIDSLHSINSKLDGDISSLILKIDTLDSNLVLKNKEIKKLKDELKKQMVNVDGFSNNELKEFFSNRYRHHFNTVTEPNR